jgi:hypothetical protein
LKQGGEQLQRSLNDRTTRLVADLNACFERLQAPLKVTHFSSWFKITYTQDCPLGELLYCSLRAKGLHTWDGRLCFLTLSHSEADFDFILTAFRDAITELQMLGFLPQLSGDRRVSVSNHNSMMASNPPMPDARLGRDPQGNPAWYMPNPDQPGNYLQVK